MTSKEKARLAGLELEVYQLLDEIDALLDDIDALGQKLDELLTRPVLYPRS